MSRRVLFVGGDKDAVLGVQSALHKEPYEIAHVKDEAEGYAYLRDVKASVVVADENMPGGRGADFLTEVQKRHPTTVRIMVTGHGDRAGLIDAVNRAEIYRFVSHPFAPPALARVLRDALTIARVAEAQEAVWTAAKKQQEAMQRLLSPEGVGSIDEADGAVAAARFAGMSPEGEPELERIGELPEEHAQRLSTREREIVEALGSGRRVKDIAQDLVISTHTVRNHLKAIYRKLNVRSQFELISLMARHSKES